MSKLFGRLAPSAANRTLRRDQLVRIATSIGSPVSGTKDEILTGIDNALNSSKSLLRRADEEGDRGKELRVLSVDLGLRNLAYAFSTVNIGKKKGQDARLTFDKPRLSLWHRTVVGTDSPIENLKTSKDPDELSGPAVVASSLAPESFEPPVLASHALAVVQTFAKLRPTHILIERQRFRSGGMAAVQEWTLRVGVFEGMLWAILQTLKQRGELECQMEAVLPARVNRFWLENIETLPENLRDVVPVASKMTGKHAKQAKIGLVQRILELQGSGSGLIDIDDGVHATVNLFQGSARSKLDDLSDSLLQCLAWLTWQENRLNLLQDAEVSLQFR